MQKEKSIGRNILIVVLILVTIASVCAGLFAWAKYQTTINGTATGETAKWSFKVSDGNTSTQEIELPMTRTDSNSSVVEGKIAPGTYGELEIGIDATGTETALTYVIEGIIENLPTNMKFYSDAERTLELTVLNNKFSKGGYMKLNEIGVRAEKIYWEWPFETTTYPVITDEKLADLEINKTEFDALIAEEKFIQANDMVDTAETNNQVSMTVVITGKQLNGNPVLADLVQVGDYVNYSASSNGTKTFASSDCADLAGTSISATISTDESFDSGAEAQWRVLSVDKETKIVELIAVALTGQKVTLSGGDGFVNAETVLNKVGAIYGQGKGATGGRSIKLEDIEQYSSYVNNTYVNNSGYAYNETEKYNDSSRQRYYEEIKEDGVVIGYATSPTIGPVEMTQTYYRYEASNYFSNRIIYNMIFKDSTDVNSYNDIFYLGSRCVSLYYTNCNFRVFVVSDGYLSARNLCNSDLVNDTYSFSLLPVVSLTSNIQTSGKNESGVWQLEVE